jgi:hypothetical protein
MPLINIVKIKEVFMDVASIASMATTMAEANTQQAISIAVLKKAMDSGAAGALSLIEAIPDNQSIQNLPSHLGQNINTTA